MKKIIRPSLAFLLALVLVLSLCACGADKIQDADPKPTESAQPEPLPSSEPESSSAPDEKPSEKPVEDEKTPEPSPEPDTVMFDLDGDGKEDYSVDFNSLEPVRTNPSKLTETFTDEASGLFMEFKLTSKGKAAELAPGFVRPYIDHTDIEYLDVQSVCGSEYRGETIKAENAETRLCAWLIDTKSGVFSVVFTYPANSTETYDAAYTAISTLKLNYTPTPTDTIGR